MTHKANIFPKVPRTSTSENNPSIAYSDCSRANLAICFSGGGSRALTCAWGQMIGLRTLGLMDRARYISSVSGGTWAASIFTFLPEGISISDLLGSYFSPSNLSTSSGTGKLNVNTLEKHSMGQAPAGISLEKLLGKTLHFLLTHPTHQHKWLWASLVAEYILEPFGLRAEGKHSWTSLKSFSLSADYAEKHFPEGAPSQNALFFARAKHPFLVMNNNILLAVPGNNKAKGNLVQLPSQVSPVAGGVQGESPPATEPERINGNGSVESYAYASTIEQDSAVESPVKVDLSQAYSLIDIVSTSSAFFANFVASTLGEKMKEPAEKNRLLKKIHTELTPAHKESLFEELKDGAEDALNGIEKELEVMERKLEQLELGGLSFVENIVPKYNYWPLEPASKNRELGFTDGGTLDNTGVIGILSQTDTGETTQEALSLVVFDNTSTPLTKQGEQIVAGTQAAPLFGIRFDEKSETFCPYTREQKSPQNPQFEAMSLIHVFDNGGETGGATQHEELVQGLYLSNSIGVDGVTSPNSSPAFYTMELKTVGNALANITAGRTVKVLYVQNAKMLNWQSCLTSVELKQEIAEGQKHPLGGLASFADFPYYSTFSKIGLEAKESNALSQMWAWAIADSSSLLRSTISQFMTQG